MRAESGGKGARSGTDDTLAGVAPTNAEIAGILDRVADLLEGQDANPHRVRAYRRAAREVASRLEPVAPLAEEEEEGKLESLPGIGESIGGAIREFVHTRRLSLLERLEGEISPEDLFCTVPGIGEELAERIHAELGVDTLEELEVAVHDGRLAQVEGFGERRLAAVGAALESILSRSTRRRARRRRMAEARRETLRGGEAERPPVETLLDVDAEYREKAAAGALRQIAPRRFNPRRDAWLPILHTEREGWHFTALFSNTARAHEFGKTDDWVVLFFEEDGHEDQCTVVTEIRGDLEGRRVVRGREQECRKLYL